MVTKDLDNYISPSAIWQLSKEYNIDAGFSLATYIWETGWGKESLAWIDGNNPAGIMCGYEYCAYDNAEQGFRAMFDLLSQYTGGSIDYVGTKITVDEVRSTWSESEDTEALIHIWNEILGGQSNEE